MNIHVRQWLDDHPVRAVAGFARSTAKYGWWDPSSQ